MTQTSSPKSKKQVKELSDRQWKIRAGAWLAVVILLATAALAFIPDWLVTKTFSKFGNDRIDQRAYVTASTSARQTVTLAIGGIIAIVTYVLSLAKHRVTKQEHALAQRKQDLEDKKFEREQEKHAREQDSLWASRYSEAITQFTNKDSLSIRLGGLYNLERIAQESINDRQPILEVLTAYLRKHLRYLPEETKFSTPAPSEITLTTREVVARIIKMSPPARLDLSGVNLENIDLEGATLIGAQLPDANLSNASLKNITLKNANIQQTEFDYADLSKAHFEGASADGAIFNDADLQGADFTQATLKNASFVQSKLATTIFSSATLDEAFFDKANLTNTKFGDSSLSGTEFQNCTHRMIMKDHEKVRPIALEDLQNAKPHRRKPLKLNPEYKTKRQAAQDAIAIPNNPPRG